MLGDAAAAIPSIEVNAELIGRRVVVANEEAEVALADRRLLGEILA